MTLELHKGDIFKSKCEALVNPCNCIGVMGAGLALVFKRKYPEMYDEYAKLCRKKLLRPGNLHIWENNGEPKFIVNFPTKDDLSPSKMEYVVEGLEALNEEILANRLEGIKSIAIPALGCGLGGLDYKQVKPLIEEFAAKLPDVLVVLYEPLE